MKSRPVSRRLLTALLYCFAAASLSGAEDLTPPFVAAPISDVAVTVSAAPTVLKLNKTFGLTGVGNKLVRFSTTLGNIDVGLLKETPKTNAVFLSYANAPGDNTTGVSSYTNTLLQNAVPGFALQGGGFYIDAAKKFEAIAGRPTIPSEAGVKNTRGTLAMSQDSGPGSATGSFFFNLVANAFLDDDSTGGPYTVFGRVTGGLKVMDAIVALPQKDFSSLLGNSFQNVPLVDYNPAQAATVDNLVYVYSVTPLPLVPKIQGGESALALKVIDNTNPGLVNAKVSGRKLTLTYAPGQTGSASITVQAQNRATKGKATASFTVTVQ